MANLVEKPFFNLGRRFLTIKAEESKDLLMFCCPSIQYRNRLFATRQDQSNNGYIKKCYGEEKFSPSGNIPLDFCASILDEDISLKLDSIEQVVYNDKPVSIYNPNNQHNAYGQSNNYTPTTTPGRLIRIYQVHSDVEPCLALFFPDNKPQSAEAYNLLKRELVNSF